MFAKTTRSNPIQRWQICRRLYWVRIRCCEQSVHFLVIMVLRSLDELVADDDAAGIQTIGGIVSKGFELVVIDIAILSEDAGFVEVLTGGDGVDGARPAPVSGDTAPFDAGLLVFVGASQIIVPPDMVFCSHAFVCTLPAGGLLSAQSLCRRYLRGNTLRR